MARLVRMARSRAARAWRRLEQLRAAGGPHGVALIYHRIGRPSADPWDMSVSPENFAAHVEILRRFGVPRTFGDFADRLASKTQGPSVAVTFDDGYADNLMALPILEAHGVPATIFVVSSAVGDPKAFWWDLLTRIFLETPSLPQHLEFEAGGKRRRYDLGAAATYGAADLSHSARWRAVFEPPEDARQKTYLDVWGHLVGLAPEEIAAAMTALRAWAGLSDAQSTDDAARPVTPSELLRLADSPLIEIGGHTRTHADLGGLSRSQAASEIGGGRRDLMEMTGRDVRSFAYPYGRFGPRTIADIREAGFACAGWSRPGLAAARSDPHALPRVHATDLSAEDFETLLSQFLHPIRRRIAGA